MSPHSKFSDHRGYDNGDIIVLVCHVISPDHVIKGKKPLRESQYPNKCGSGDGVIIVHYVIS